MAAILEHTTHVDGMDAVVELVAGRRVAVLTGAGVSTDSGIPDYRGKGASKRTPMNISDFLSSHTARQRYWAGAHVGWKSFSEAEPNQGHLALAAMEQSGIIEGVISQNVDGLHRRAGSSHVVDLHGSLDRVLCLDCGQQFDRSGVESKLSALNPWLDELRNIVLAPDGDVDVTDYNSVLIPECTVCGGMLKPDVVFFGEFVPAKVFSAATSLVKRADALLIAGSSLTVNSGIRLLEQAKRQRMPVIIVNRGETKGDKKASLKLDAGTSDVLSNLAVKLGAGNLYEDIE
ncbi:Sir2 family NAD-dependent protein deacetylase [Aurantimicrobium minutum]|uniref:Sir2 family NAD-dependent protein deacetylase n=1 Tax=Aurantimicrobium minutum TaxID=708131 RepID=UPI002474C648|nr:Sir2 family NAD-dependent protein deacetylase [Aurantimicrobium minutum]MDH6422655.1 NAD-dependent SIR2 family protein deacetylase [Aurantimicrobium minutum]